MTIGFGAVLLAAQWLGQSAVTAAPLANFVGLNGAPCAYPTIGDALAAAVDGDTVYLAPNLFNETLGVVDIDLHFIAATPDCTAANPSANPADHMLDGGGAAAPEGGMVSIASGHTVTFTRVTLQQTQALRGGVVYVAEEGTAVFNTAVVRDGWANDSGGLIYVAPNGSLRLQHASQLSNGSAGNAGGGLYVAGSAEIRFGSRIENSTAPSGGGAAVGGDGSLLLRSSYVGSGLSPNTAAAGGGVHLTGQARLELRQGSLVRWNIAAGSHGGGIYAAGNVAIDLYGSSRVYGNESTHSGGGIYLSNGASLTLHDTSQVGHDNPASGNQAARGGGIHALQAQQVTLSAGTAVLHNRATETGGGILVNETPLAMHGGLIHGNSSDIRGGGVAIIDSSADLEGVEISANSAGWEGGGLHQMAAPALNTRTYITNSQILSNTAGLSGGGFSTFDAPLLVVDTDGSTVIDHNHSDLHGGAAYTSQTGGLVLLAETAGSRLLVTNNTANADGGALYAESASNVFLAGRVELQANIAAGSGGAIYQDTGEIVMLGVDDQRPLVNKNEALNGSGGGLYLSGVGGLSNSRLRNVTISQNVADSQGGGLFVNLGSLLRIENGLIHDNAASEGGGLLVNNATVLMRPHTESCANALLPADHYCSELRGNDAGFSNGGGVRMVNGARLELSHTAVIGNSALLGSGIYSASSTDHLEITNALFSHNSNKALFLANASFLDLVQTTFAANDWAIDVNHAGATVSQNNNIVWGNGFGVESAVIVPPNCSISQNGVYGSVDDPLWETTLRGDFRLVQPSPAVNSCGMGVDFDLDGIPRPQESGYDMGAFESGRPLLLFTPSVDVQEGGAVPLTLYLSQPSAGAVTVRVTAVAGSAAAGADFVPLDETILFPAGTISRTVVLETLDDILYEGDEALALEMSDGSGVEITGNTAAVTIVENDPLPTLTVSGSAVQEGDSGTTPLQFSVQLSHPSVFPVTVEYNTGDDGDTADEGEDYEGINGILTLPAGQTSATLNVRVFGDEDREPDEQFTLRLINPNGAVLAAPEAAGTILDDDGDQLLFLPFVSR